MNSEHPPTCWIIAGPNGAGKTTFAVHYLPHVVSCETFVNADLIAAGIAPLAPAGRAISASRMFLTEVSQHIRARRDFGFETTLSGLSYRRLITRLQSDQWRVELIYLALPSLEMAMQRVAERALHGGHNIQRTDIERRFTRSIRNFLNEYSFMVDRADCYLNSELQPVRVFTQQGSERSVAEPDIFNMLRELARGG